jgi:hypothetical protein
MPCSVGVRGVGIGALQCRALATAIVDAIAAGSQHKTIKSMSHLTAVSESVPTVSARYWTGPIAASTRSRSAVSAARCPCISISVREKCSVRQVNLTISLAFLAPNLVQAALEGRLPRGVGIERLRDLPAEWSRHFEALGLNPE